mmetsp:Transcript_1661/g.4454  ORF Transcript_1661/g.4454 Transcript_1661/m.4454 type:complete len:249 (+) Transcript_1661:581-1327(+)
MRQDREAHHLRGLRGAAADLHLRRRAFLVLHLPPARRHCAPQHPGAAQRLRVHHRHARHHRRLYLLPGRLLRQLHHRPSALRDPHLGPLPPPRLQPRLPRLRLPPPRNPGRARAALRRLPVRLAVLLHHRHHAHRAVLLLDLPLRHAHDPPVLPLQAHLREVPPRVLHAPRLRPRRRALPPRRAPDPLRRGTQARDLRGGDGVAGRLRPGPARGGARGRRRLVGRVLDADARGGRGADGRDGGRGGGR